uniref:TclN n=1 Tax=Macrococcoides caseolyticum TaxID=69966 RepID=A0A097PTA2_9STAP|nr:hypothetical protein [Macrococcus caseolyticus]AIU53949.1 TclN [Macrococcus caseolyticus]
MDISKFLYNLHYNPGEVVSASYTIEDTIQRNSEGFYKGYGIDFLKLQQKSPIVKVILKSYGDIFFNRVENKKKPLIFCRKMTPSGGGLYPINIFICTNFKNRIALFQFDFKRNLLIFIKYINIEINNECTKLYLVPCYTRNYFKYKEFSYRLCPLDTGYLISTLLYNFSVENITFKLSIKLNKNSDITDVLNEIGCEEIPYSIIELNESLNLDNLSLEHYDTESYFFNPNKVRNLLEIDTLIHQEYHKDININFNNENKLFEKFEIQKRISPGGEFIQNSKVEQESINKFISLIMQYKNKSNFLSEYILLNLIDVQNKRIINLSASEFLSYKNNVSIEFIDKQLTRRNFNLLAVPYILYVGVNEEKIKENYSNNYFKISRIIAGFWSGVVSILSAQCGLSTHPMMSYNARELEEYIFKNRYSILNQIVIGGNITTNRMDSMLIRSDL